MQVEFINKPTTADNQGRKMDNQEIRYQNLLVLLRQHQETRGGHERGLLKEWGEMVGISEKQVSHLRSQRRNIGTSTARRIEAELKLPNGWMDHEHREQPDEHEKKYLETALRLFRASPASAYESMIEKLGELGKNEVVK